MNILQDYLTIYERYPLGEYLPKEARRARFEALRDWELFPYEALPSAEALQDFVFANEDKVLLSVPFFKKLRSIWAGGEGCAAWFARLLLHLREGLNTAWALDLETDDLISALLADDPDDPQGLTLWYDTLRKGFWFSLHELPWAILLDDDLPTELARIDEFETLSQRLGKDDRAMIAECRMFYNALADFRTHKEQYKGLEDYLRAHQLPLRYSFR
ncbi:hypothetical protein SAMN05444369_11193 [Capnocytophaga haemolytica]|uniref:DUF4123 domain-containing protein n=1 Tax=Capnocytophaga haemolytica TaxID=45243 RepID=A0AAX2H1U7_9FLAO|nr:hypothetical protein [Capnocytophaga haemolytica]AMD86020.1 hypothetical protein AXF12_11185 [Capnocytophaga haemolytica]SFO16850.1 hypothetical protein SAMN05444369_11193 [Capnocytophaga haemolytica]SNV14752.1 Uncharacterised protein [Capnocytophaga haemolytica]